MKTARAIAHDVRSGAATALEVAEEALARAAAYDAVQPQAWISRFGAEAVLAAARAVDARIAAGEVLPLAGVPFAVKDNIDVVGLPTTAACPAFAYDPVANAFTVQRMIDAGAICLGKTNLDQFATGLNGTRSPYGAPRCVANLDYVSGGSSSGSAVVVGAGVVPLALGTDTAGSGRVPAAFNGLVGLKPTKGRWSTSGLTPACRSLDCITVFALDAEDAALADSVIAGFDLADAYSRELADLPVGKVLGVPLPAQRPWFGDLEAEYLYARALERLEAQGYALVEVDIAPLLEAAKLLYSGPWVAERTAAVEDLLRGDPGAFDPTVREIVEGGTGVSAIEAFRGQYQLMDYARAAQLLWREVDALAVPTSPVIYRVREMLANPVALNSHFGTYTNFVNLLDMAAIAVPAGYRRNGTGFGISLFAPAGSDRALIDFALDWAHPGERPTLDTGGKVETTRLAVVGAHLEGMPLHWQLTSRGAKFVCATETAPSYRLFAMADSVPPKPALVFDESGGAIKVEVYEIEIAAFGSFVVEVPPPLAIGTVTLADGSQVKGFVAEPRALAGAEDITALGGWRAFISRN
ncbi:allophanate hydrolase [Novosphingobium flavum]|uniref:Allophanate hydrolase n=1 Tax=Novosphingobium flavum TaxID=1778672 RepID=A0A7X1FTT1_9SPHN|nr:allophanate hydrolase [Novosphingobium flavum]MBC2666860.1 allophanate hydrolase [Novosphingobium flavum]